MPKAGFWSRAAVIGFGAVMVVWLAAGFFTKPASLKPFIGVFGVNPLGIPTPVAATLILAGLVAPFVGFMLRGLDLAVLLRQLEGRPVTGTLGVMLATRRHWAHPGVRHLAWAALEWLGLFVLACGTWIVATAIAGV